jgi:Ca2+-binding EF-hand superfamily protein
MFDRDQNGTISFEEVREILGTGKPKESDEVFKEIIKEMDIDGDGLISFDEFEQVMTK